MNMRKSSPLHIILRSVVVQKKAACSMKLVSLATTTRMQRIMRRCVELLENPHVVKMESNAIVVLDRSKSVYRAAAAAAAAPKIT